MYKTTLKDGYVQNHVQHSTNLFFQSIRDNLTVSAISGMESAEDRQYRENLAQGRDKFKTLREVRKGNTKRRIDTFENM